MREVSLARQLAAPLAALVVLVVVVGIAGGGSVWFATRSIQEVTDRIAPIDRANAAVLQDLTDAETGIRGWALSGESAALEPYQVGTARLPKDQARLGDLAEDDRELAELVAEQDRRIEEWLRDYAHKRVAGGGAPRPYDAELFDVGRARFDAIRAVNGEIAREVEARHDEAHEEADRRLLVTFVTIAAVTLLGVQAGWLLLRRLRWRTLPPLEELESVASRLAEGDVTARASVRGPREVQLVARALNALAEENQRAREAEEAIEAELRTLDAARGDFVSNVSHELRTPLTSIAGYLELLQEQLEDEISAPQRRMVDAIDRNVVRLRTLVEDLLTLSRAENRGTDLEQIELRDLVQDVVADLGIAADRREVRISVDVPKDAVAVLADRGQLYRVFLNVLGNAIKFSHPGGPVQVTMSLFGREVVTQVIDQGIGIPADDLSKIGGRFFRARNAVAQELPGTGLGLRITQTIVRNHGGRMELQSVEGEGTRVVVWLPLQGDADEDAADLGESSPGA